MAAIPGMGYPYATIFDDYAATNATATVVFYIDQTATASTWPFHAKAYTGPEVGSQEWWDEYSREQDLLARKWPLPLRISKSLRPPRRVFMSRNALSGTQVRREKRKARLQKEI